MPQTNRNPGKAVYDRRNAAYRRSIAVGTMMELAMPTPRDTCRDCDLSEGQHDGLSIMHRFEQVTYGSELGEMSASDLATNIRKLAQLGRAARWQRTVSVWASMVEQSQREATSEERSQRL